MMEIKQLRTRAQKELHRALLLDADPSWEMIETYLGGDMYVLYDGGQAAAEAVVTYREDLGMPELKNIAVAPAFRKRGLARQLIAYLQKRYGAQYGEMCVGTCTISDGPLRLYRSCGFMPWFVEQHFFTHHYPEPIFEEDGRRCIHMQYLRCTLPPKHSEK